MSLKTLAVAAVAAMALATPALAHHSFSMFANDKTVTIKATVREFEWTNPHSWLHVAVMTSEGKAENWSFEMGSPAQLSVRGGWKPDTLKPGDIITLQMHPMKDGSRGGSYVAVKLPAGTVLGNWQGEKPAS
jgi:hypothetical protein